LSSSNNGRASRPTISLMLDMFYIPDPEELRLAEIWELSQIYKIPEPPKKTIEPGCNMVLIDMGGNIRCMNHDVRILGALIFPPEIRIPLPPSFENTIFNAVAGKLGVEKRRLNTADFYLSSVQDGVAYYHQKRKEIPLEDNPRLGESK
jgi:hypothetical protein